MLEKYPFSRISGNITNSNQRLTGRAFTRYFTSEKRVRSGGYLALSRLCLRVWGIHTKWYRIGMLKDIKITVVQAYNSIYKHVTNTPEI